MMDIKKPQDCACIFIKAHGAVSVNTQIRWKAVNPNLILWTGCQYTGTVTKPD